ncbi:MAG: hypothetical protein IJE80_05085 [Peptococcaceae bacterium]|nr:hypothetical protein [Peptococcaceae bacterium]
MHKKMVWIILDSAGIGALPDAADYGDAGANTLQHIAQALPELQLPVMNAMGLEHLTTVKYIVEGEGQVR